MNGARKCKEDEYIVAKLFMVLFDLEIDQAIIVDYSVGVMIKIKKIAKYLNRTEL